MVETLLLSAAIWLNTIGFVVFCGVYMYFAKPWLSPMGRRVLIFMSGLALSFIYLVTMRFFRDSVDLVWILRGWIAILFMLALVVWGAVVVLIKYQIDARKTK